MAIVMLLTGCGFPPAVRGLQQAAGNVSSTPTLSVPQETMRVAMQHLLDLLNTTQRDGTTTLTTRIASSGHTGGHANTAIDYALGRVAANEATLELTWYFNDPITNTDVSGTIELRGIRVDDPGDRAYAARITYAYRETSKPLGNTDDVFLQGYSKPSNGSALQPIRAPRTINETSGHWSVAEPNGQPGSIQIPLAPITWEIRSAMIIPEGLLGRSDQEVLDVQSAQWLSPGDDQPQKLQPTYTTGDEVRCGLPQGFSAGLMGSANVEVGKILWGVQEGRQANPGLHPNEQIVLDNGLELINAATVVVNPDKRTGTMQGSQPRQHGGTNTVSGRWVCPPSSVVGGDYS